MITKEPKYCMIKVITLIVIYIFDVSGKVKKENGLIYILEWTTAKKEPFKFIQPEQTSFLNCEYQNCFVTDNVSYFEDITYFDVVMFNIYNLQRGLHATVLPTKRSEQQRYVFVALEPAAYFRLSTHYNNFFNLTWTYKLTSDAIFPYITVKNKRGEIIGPKKEMYWMDMNKMKPITKNVKNKLKKKRTAAAWIVSNCGAVSNRNDFVKMLQTNLTNYGLTIDIFGDCGNHECPRDNREIECYALIESDYYFYLAFENSFCEDYVSEKVLRALQHFSVPIVFGGANYSSFMPEGSFLNARRFDPQELAKKMNEIIHDKTNYYDFFKWHRYYRFHNPEDSGYNDEICALCAMLNNVIQTNGTSIYSKISLWWNEHPDLSDTLIDAIITDGQINV